MQFIFNGKEYLNSIKGIKSDDNNNNNNNDINEK